MSRWRPSASSFDVMWYYTTVIGEQSCSGGCYTITYIVDVDCKVGTTMGPEHCPGHAWCDWSSMAWLAFKYHFSGSVVQSLQSKQGQSLQYHSMQLWVVDDYGDLVKGLREVQQNHISLAFIIQASSKIIKSMQELGFTFTWPLFSWSHAVHLKGCWYSPDGCWWWYAQYVRTAYTVSISVKLVSSWQPKNDYHSWRLEQPVTPSKMPELCLGPVDAWNRSLTAGAISVTISSPSSSSSWQ